MASVEFRLNDGLRVGKDTLMDIVLREPTAGDIIEAQEEAERLLYVVRDNRAEPALIASPSMVGVHVLRRQIVRIGDISGPIDLALLKKMTPYDFNLVQCKADELEHAASADAASAEVAQRGRGVGNGSID